MASVTPSNLFIANAGSVQLSVARFDDSVVAGTDYWASSISNIISVVGVLASAPATSGAPLGVSFTATSGTIHITNQSSSALDVWIMSGFGQDVWAKP